ncbi:hypothetical protein C8Q78DRAFT_496080 [Trametes maxima]|nr:hypothetical protein C8Q78DRAFT_496080 [Trametes maxima]
MTTWVSGMAMLVAGGVSEDGEAASSRRLAHRSTKFGVLSCRALNLSGGINGDIEVSKGRGLLVQTRRTGVPCARASLMRGAEKWVTPNEQTDETSHPPCSRWMRIEARHNILSALFSPPYSELSATVESGYGPIRMA